MDEELQLRITSFFDWWRQRHVFISKLDLIEQRFESNILLWGSLDALSNWWAKSISEKKYNKGDKKIIFDAFLARYGGQVFQFVSLPDVWNRVDRGDTCIDQKKKKAKKLPENVSIFLSTIGERRNPDLMEEHQTRSTSNDLSMDNIINQTLAIYPQTIRGELEQWLAYSRYGAIAYKVIRNAYIHEGQPGKTTHDFQLHGWKEKPTYLSPLFCASPVMGFSVEFMLGVFKRCIEEFEAEALKLKMDPAPY